MGSTPPIPKVKALQPHTQIRFYENAGWRDEDIVVLGRKERAKTLVEETADEETPLSRAAGSMRENFSCEELNLQKKEGLDVKKCNDERPAVEDQLSTEFVLLQIKVKDSSDLEDMPQEGIPTEATQS